MRILGIDYGRKKIGVSKALGSIAEPFGVLRIKTSQDALDKIKKIVEKEKIQILVIGISEGKMAEETKDFAKELESFIEKPVVYQDETLSTKDAQNLAKQANISRKKLKKFEDAYAATLILQDYLDANI